MILKGFLAFDNGLPSIIPPTPSFVQIVIFESSISVLQVEIDQAWSLQFFYSISKLSVADFFKRLALRWHRIRHFRGTTVSILIYTFALISILYSRNMVASLYVKDNCAEIIIINTKTSALITITLKTFQDCIITTTMFIRE